MQRRPTRAACSPRSRATPKGRAARTLLIAAASLAALAAINHALARRAERRHPSRGKFISVDGVLLHYLDEGVGEPPMVLIHGNGAMAEEQVASGLVALLAQDHRVIVFDRPGSGYSARPAGRSWTAEAQGALLRAALRLLNIERAVLVGHSWGTLVALAMALTAPQETATLVLIAGPVMPLPRLDVEGARWIAIPFLGPLLIHTIVPPIVRLVVPWVRRRIFSPRAIPRRFHRDYPRALLLRPSQLEAVARDTLTMIPSAVALSPRYRDLTMPVTIIAGTDDKIVPCDVHSGALHAMLPGSAYHEIRGGGHMVHHVATDRVAALICAAANAASKALAGNGSEA